MCPVFACLKACLPLPPLYYVSSHLSKKTPPTRDENILAQHLCEKGGGDIVIPFHGADSGYFRTS